MPSGEVWRKFFLNPGSNPATSFRSPEKQNALYAAGQHFAKTYPESLIHVQKLTSNIFQNIGIKNSKIIKDKDVRFSESDEGTVLQKNSSKSDTDLGKLLMPVNKSEEYESKLEKAKVKMASGLRLNKENENKEGMVRELGDNLRKEKNGIKLDKEKQEALQFMCGIMDECTHLKNFSVPVDTELVISVTAKADGYVPRDGLTDLQELWRGSEVRYLNTGHISAYILHQKFFRLAIMDAFEKLKMKYYNDEKNTAQCK